MVNLFAGLKGKTLPEGFTWLNEPAEWTFTEEGLVVQAEPQTDYFIDPAGTAVKDLSLIHILSAATIIWPSAPCRPLPKAGCASQKT